MVKQEAYFKWASFFVAKVPSVRLAYMKMTELGKIQLRKAGKIPNSN